MHPRLKVLEETGARSYKRVEPDMVDVIAASLSNPLAGLGAIVKKVARKANEEAR